MKKTSNLLDVLLIFFSFLAGCAAGVSIYTGLGPFTQLEWEVLVTGYGALIAAIFTIRAMIRTDVRQENRHRQLVGISLRRDALMVDQYYGMLDSRLHEMDSFEANLLEFQAPDPDVDLTDAAINEQVSLMLDLKRFSSQYRHSLTVQTLLELFDFEGFRAYSRWNDSVLELEERARIGTKLHQVSKHGVTEMVQVPMDIAADLSSYVSQLHVCRQNHELLLKYIDDLRSRYAFYTEMALQRD